MSQIHSDRQMSQPSHGIKELLQVNEYFSILNFYFDEITKKTARSSKVHSNAEQHFLCALDLLSLLVKENTSC